MKIMIRGKLILAISTLMVVLFTIAAYLFISEKRTEIADDIYANSLAFARLTAPTVAYNYDLYLAQDSFVYFNREIQSIFEQNDDVSAISVISYDGVELYNSDKDKDKKYDGESRAIRDPKFLEQIQSENISVLTSHDRTVFIRDQIDSTLKYVDENERAVEPLEKGTLLKFLAVPGNEKYSIIYELDYTNMEIKVERMMRRIIYLALFGITLGMLLSYFMSSQVTRPVKKLVDGAGEIAKGNFKTRVDIKTHDELSFLGEAFNKMAIDLESSVEARVYQERVAHELEIATQIQQQLVPRDIPQVEGLQIAAGLLPATEIGGDIYDFITVGEDRILMYLGDVTGHGVPAGIVSSVANALFYGYSKEPDIKKILVNVNEVLDVKTLQTMFMTLCLMDFSIKEQKLRYISAGHEQVIHYKAKTSKAGLLPSGGVALGMIRDISKVVQVNDVDFEVGDFLILYSDGIPEAWRDTHEKYGMERFLESVEALGGLKTADEMKVGILENVKTFSAGYEQMDDITLVVIKKV